MTNWVNMDFDAECQHDNVYEFEYEYLDSEGYLMSYRVYRCPDCGLEWRG